MLHVQAMLYYISFVFVTIFFFVYCWWISTPLDYLWIEEKSTKWIVDKLMGHREYLELFVQLKRVLIIFCRTQAIFDEWGLTHTHRHNASSQYSMSIYFSSGLYFCDTFLAFVLFLSHCLLSLAKTIWIAIAFSLLHKRSDSNYFKQMMMTNTSRMPNICTNHI